MPQAVSIFPNVQSSPPRSNSSTSNGDGGSSKFDDMLDSARQKDATDASQSKSAGDSSAAAKSRKSGKSDKSGKSTSAKPAAKSAAKAKTATAPDEETETSEAEAAADPAKAALPAAVPAPEGAATESTAGPGKSKEASHPGQSEDPTADEAQMMAQQQQPGFAIKAIGKDGRKSDADQRGKGAKGQAAIAAISDAGDGDGEEEAAGAPDALTQAGQGSTAGAKSKLASTNENGPTGVQAVNGYPAVGNAPPQTTSSASDASADDAVVAAPIAPAKDEPTSGSQPTPVPQHPVLNTFSDVLQSTQGQVSSAEKKIAVPAPHPAPTSAAARETEFAEANHGKIISGVTGQLLPNGGSLQLRLDPAELGAVNISVHMRDGVMTATFDTSNDQAARLLTHSLGQLKTALESQGVSVGGLHVQQTPRGSQAGFHDSRQQGNSGSNDASQQERQQEQQRKDMVRRMWRRLNGGKDPLDLVA